MQAVIKTGGKQYFVKAKDTLKIEKIPGQVGEVVVLDQVLLIANGQELELGGPVLANKKIEAKILAQGRAKKITAVKYKPKTRYRRQLGHRQAFTEIEIIKV